jgi:CRP-like cAMP-binding protein
VAALKEVDDLGFASMSYFRQRALIDSCMLHTYQPGEAIFMEGDKDQNQLFIVVASESSAKEAAVEVVKTAQGSEKFIHWLSRGDIFGQTFFLTHENLPRDVTVRVPTDCVCSVTVASIFPYEFEKLASFRRALLIKSVPLMQLISSSQRKEVVAMMSIRSFPDGEFIIKQGEGVCMCVCVCVCVCVCLCVCT